MKLLLSYILQYYKSVNKKVFLITSLLVAVLISINFTVGIESRISQHNNHLLRIAGFFLLYLLVFSSAYWIHFSLSSFFWPVEKSFYALLIISAALFAWKIATQNSAAFITDNMQFPWQKFAALTLDWPIKAIVFLLIILAVWKLFALEKPLGGMSGKNLSVSPYLILLLCMLPLLAFASTQSDFLQMYPKLKKIFFIFPQVESPVLPSLAYELSYGTDFFSIELFFRGLLVLGMMKYVGKDAILPMAAFYCSIHFGKPLLECVSSFFGGIILGVVVYRTRSIWGGLIVHLGIAWLMELGGYIGSRYFG